MTYLFIIAVITQIFKMCYIIYILTKILYNTEKYMCIKYKNVM